MNTKAIIVIGLSATIVMGFIVSKRKIKIWTDQVKVGQVIAFEESQCKKIEYVDMNVSLSKSYYPLLDQFNLAPPIIIKRDQSGLIPLYVHYYYSQPDSILRYVYYNWERAYQGNFSTLKTIWKEESTKLEQYNLEYESIKSDLIEQFGSPETEDKSPHKNKSEGNGGSYLSRETNWESDNYSAELTMTFADMTYHIRATYYWK